MARYTLHNSSNIRTKKEIHTNDNGKRCKLTIKYIKSAKLKLVLITDSYSRFVGYDNRADFLKDAGLLQHISIEVYHNPATGLLYLLEQLKAVSLN